MFTHNPTMKRKTIVDTLPKLRNLQSLLFMVQEFAFDTETNTLKVHGKNKNFKLVGISISWGEFNNYYIPVGHSREEDYDHQLDLETVVEYLKEPFGREDLRVVGHNLKFDMHVLKRVGIDINTNDLVDTMILSWLCDENTPNGLKENSQKHLKISQEKYVDVLKTVPNEVKVAHGLKAANKPTFDLVLIKDAYEYALADSFYTWELYLGFIVLIEEEKMDKIYFKVYAPFIRTLYMMEERGVVIDLKRLDQMSHQIEEDMEQMKYDMFEYSGVEFNPSSSQHLYELLFGYQKTKKNGEPGAVNHDIIKHSFRFPVISETPGGVPQTGSEVLWQLANMSYRNARKKEGIMLCRILSEYKRLDKLRSAFIEGLKDQIYDDGKVHPSFNIIGTDSGRISCIAENTPIQLVGGAKPIQEVQVGDLAYCYNDAGELKARKVTRVIDNGVRPCVHVNWVSQGTHKEDRLTCTPDHSIRLSTGEWVEAQDLLPNDKLTHLRKSDERRPRLYGLNGFALQEQLFIKQEVLDSTDECIHHIDGDTRNNVLDNLMLMSRPEHARLHANELVKQGRIRTDQLRVPHRVLEGAEHPMYKSFSAEELESLVHEYQGRIRDIPIDFDTFKKKCREVNFDYKQVAGQYQKRYREVSDSEFIETFFECKGVPYAISQRLDIGRVKTANTIERLNLCYNHKVQSVEEAGEYHVYDLEVEEFHNFIASEVCVHNCSSPNLQQLPKADDDDKYQIRSLFIGSMDVATLSRKKIIALDFANLEMRVLAHFSEDKNLLAMFERNEDTHGSTAVNMFELDCDASEVKKKYPHLRQAAKVLNFLLMYGGGAFRLYHSLKLDHFNPIDLGDPEYLKMYNAKNGEEVAQIYVDKYFSTYSGVADFIRSQKKLAHRNEYVHTLLRRKRRLPDINSNDMKSRSYCERLAVNSAVQGSAADITMSAQNRIMSDPWFEEHRVYMLIQVHDELVFESPEEYVEEAIVRIKRYMEHPFGDHVELNLPLIADADFGDNYQESK